MSLRLAAVPLALAALLATTSALAAPSNAVAVGGAVDHPASLDAAALQALPQVTQTDTFTSGAASQTHTYIGPRCGASSTRPASRRPARRTTC